MDVIENSTLQEVFNFTGQVTKQSCQELIDALQFEIDEMIVTGSDVDLNLKRIECVKALQKKCTI